MELRHLRYFVTVAEEENVSRAALKLHVSQPGLSRQVHDLEGEIGFPLFERTAKSLKLTDAGKTFLGEARAVLLRADEAVKKARTVAAGTAGELHVAYAPSLTVRILPQALRTFQAEFPKVRVALHDLSTEEMLSALREGKLQVALMAPPKKSQLRGLHFRVLARYPLCIAVAPNHPLAKLKSVALKKIISEPLIAYSRQDYPDYHENVEMIFSKIGKMPRIAEEHDGITSIMAAVQSGRGFALVPSAFACMAGPGLKVVPIDAPVPPIVVGAAWKIDGTSLLIDKFVAAAVAAGKEQTVKIPAEAEV